MGTNHGGQATESGPSSSAGDASTFERFGEASFLRRLIEQAPVGMLVFADREIVFATEEAAGAFGQRPEALVGTQVTEVLTTADGRTRPQLPEVEAGDEHRLELTAHQTDENDVPIRLDLRGLPFASGTLTAGFLHRRREGHGDERPLERHEVVAELAGDGVFQLGPEGQIEMVSDAVLEMTGHGRDELLAGPVGELFAPDAQTDVEAAIERLSDSGSGEIEAAEVEVSAASGERIPCECRLTILDSPRPEPRTVGVIRDVTDRKEQGEELRQERELIEQVLETSPVGIGVITPDGDISRVNDRAEELFGLTDYEISNRTLDVSQRRLYDSEGKQVSPEDLLSRVFDEGERVLDTEFEFGQPDGERVWQSISIAPMTDAAGDVQKAVIIATDITDRKEHERTLQQERELIEHILETSPVGIGVITPDGDISRVNDRAQELLGLTMEEITNQTLDVSQRKLYDSEGEKVPAEDLLGRVFDDGEQVLNSEFTLEHPDGDRVWAALSIAPMTDATGEVEKAVVIATDITDRKEREETLREERDVIEHILETSPVGIGVITPDGDISRVNDRAEELFGLTDYELSNQLMDVSQRQLSDAEGHQVEPEDLLSRVFEDGERVLDTEFELGQPDGDRVWLAISIAPIEGRSGNIEKAVIIGKDVTDRKEREETLREERDVIEHILETSPVGIGVITPDGDISRVNDRAEELLGLTMEEITNRTLDVSQRKLYGSSGERVPPEDLLGRVFDDGEQVINSEFTLERPDGDRVWAALSLAPIRNQQGEVEKAVVIATDISDRKERERRLRESEARLRQIAENINSALWMADADMSEVLYINPAYETITGRSRDSVFDNLMNHLDAVHPQDKHRVARAMKQATGRQHDGKDSLRFEEKYRIIRPDGSTRWVHSFAFPLRNDEDEVYRFVGVIDDITDVKEQQLELGRHRDELERLNQINTVIRRINQGLVRATTRGEIESQVCETLTDSQLYHAAWIGETDGSASAVDPKDSTGLNLDSSEAPLEVSDVDPIATALESGDVQVIRDLNVLPPELTADNPSGGRIADHGEQFGAVIPLVYKETVYDILVAYSSRANAFSAREQSVLQELGKTIGLAMNAVERKKALLTDTVVELTFDVSDEDLFLIAVSDESDATLELEGVTSQGDGSFLQYFSVSHGAVDEVLEAAEEHSTIESARLVSEHGDTALVEFIVAGSSLAVTLAEYGGSVREASFEDGAGTVVVDLPRSADTRTAVDAVQSSFSETDLVSKRERERSVQTDEEFQSSLEDSLTERQLTVLETAFYAGYFEWSRDSTGEEVAESLDVSPATFHQHVRAGERKLVETLIDVPVAT